MPNEPTALVTGANRGIGLEYVRQLLKANYHVIATCRDPETADTLHQFQSENQRLDIYPLEVTDAQQLNTLQANLRRRAIDLLILNAGVLGQTTDRHAIDADELLGLFKINAQAPMLIANALLHNVAASQQRTIAFMTSRMASIGDNDSGGRYAYRASKAALNAMAHAFAIDHKDIHVLLLHPGHVRTDMTQGHGLINADESVRNLLNIIQAHKQYASGSFLHHEGYALPW